MESQAFASKEDFWRLQEAFNDLSASQVQQAERIMRLEKKSEDGTRPRNLWGPVSPFPTGLSVSHPESTLNPAAEAFKNFDVEPPSNMISSLTLDNHEEARRAAVSRANSVRFDETANNHYTSSRQSIDLPTRTGSGMGSHPLSERSLSHRSDGRGSTAGFGRANSFGLEGSKLLGSIHNSPRVSGHPPPGLFALAPCPSIVRCWLTENFTNDALLYAAVCTGAAVSSIGLPLLQKLALAHSVFEENGLRKIKLLVYLTEAKVLFASSRSVSPSPSVPTVTTKFVIDDQPIHDKSIQIVLGSDILRSQSADVLLSEDKLKIYDDDRNQLSVPLVRPEDDSAYRHLTTRARSRRQSAVSETPPDLPVEYPTPGVIARPSRLSAVNASTSPPLGSPDEVLPPPSMVSDYQKAEGSPDTPARPSTADPQPRPGDESKSTDSSEKSTTASFKPQSGVWSTSWRSVTNSGSADPSNAGKGPSSSYSRPNVPRPMKVLRPQKPTNVVARSISQPGTPINNSEPAQLTTSSDVERKASQSGDGEVKPAPTKSNPIGSASAFGWLNSGQPRKATTNGGP